MFARKAVLILNAAVVLAAVLFFACLTRYGEGSRIAPAPGPAGKVAVVRVARQQEIYPVYRSAGMWGVRVIHLNRFFNMSVYTPMDLFPNTPFPLVMHPLMQAYDQAVNSHTWLYIATRRGVVRAVTSVVPDQQFQQMVENPPPGDLFTVSRTAITGFTQDIPRTIVRMETLPQVAEPVVVNVDAGFFSGGADPSATAALLRKRCPDVRLMVLSDSIDEPEVTAAMRAQLRSFEAAWRSQS